MWSLDMSYYSQLLPVRPWTFVPTGRHPCSDARQQSWHTDKHKYTIQRWRSGRLQLSEVTQWPCVLLCGRFMWYISLSLPCTVYKVIIPLIKFLSWISAVICPSLWMCTRSWWETRNICVFTSSTQITGTLLMKL